MVDNQFNSLVKTSNETHVPNSMKDTTNDILKRVEKVADISKKKLDEIYQKSNDTKDAIVSIIRFDPKNKRLANFLLGLDALEYYSYFHPLLFNDAEILEAACISSPDIIDFKIFREPLILLLRDIKKSKKLANIVLNNFIKQGKSIRYVHDFLHIVSGDDEFIFKSLDQQYKDLLKKAGNIYENDVKKSVLNLQDKDVLHIFIEKKIIDNSGNIIKQSVKIIEKQLQNFLEKKQLEGNKENILIFLGGYFGLSSEQLKKHDILALLDSICNLLHISPVLKELGTNQKSEKAKEDQSEEESSGEEEIDSKDDDLLEFCAPDCNLSYGGGSYFIETPYSMVEVEQEEYKKFSSQGLENFLKFHRILQETGLGFLFDSKNKSDIVQLLRNSLDGFEYTTGDGFSDTYIIKTLTLIANLIGVPKKMYGEGKELGKFKDIVEAKKLFININGTGFVNGEKVASPGSFLGNGVTEELLYRNGTLKKNGGVDIQKATDILSDGPEKKKEESDRESDVFLDLVDSVTADLLQDGNHKKDGSGHASSSSSTQQGKSNIT